MKKGGVGGSLTKTGLEFEKRVDIRELFQGIKGYTITGNMLFYDSKLVAKFYKKHEFYKFLEQFSIDWADKLSKRLLPDETVYVLKNNALFVIEMKFQYVSGSVDEKLQTCDFKKKQYSKLLSSKSIKVEYVYVLSEWFKQSIYRDTLEYIDSVNCHYFFKTLPLDFLGLSIPKN